MQEIFLFEINIVEHCNLNCQMCDHFSPIANESFICLNEFTNSLKQMSRLLKNVAVRIILVGGEPTLHPELNKLLSISRDIFPHAQIVLISNGIKLPQIDDEFWKSCHLNNVEIKITKYPIKLNYDLIEKIAKSEKVNLTYMNTKPIKTSFFNPFDLTGKQNSQNSFYDCTYSSRCNTLKGKKLFPCPVIASASHFNNYFKVDLKITETDYIDIFNVHSIKEIYDFLKTPIPFCKYCDVVNRKQNLEWKISKKQKSEWCNTSK